MITSLTQFFFFLVCITITLSICLFYYYKKLKIVENNRLQLIEEELKLEKKNSIVLENTSVEVNLFKINIQNKLLNIKTLIFNMEFTISEIFS